MEEKRIKHTATLQIPLLNLMTFSCCLISPPITDRLLENVYAEYLCPLPFDDMFGFYSEKLVI